MKECSKCGASKDEREFSPAYSSRYPDYRRPDCKSCRAQFVTAWYHRTGRKDVRREQRLERRDQDPAASSRYWRERHYQKNYGLSLASVERMREDQEGACLICGVEAARLVVDHDHETGRIRGLLCVACNVGIGWLERNSDRLAFALEYIS